MSQGPFIIGRYNSTLLGATFPVLIQPETLMLRIGVRVNIQGFPINRALSFRAGGDRRALGLHCRMINFRFLDGEEPPGYKRGGRLSLPFLRGITEFTQLTRGQTGLYLGRPIVFTGSLPELAR